MSFRATFPSAGGFTTQRLDLILKKRKDEKDEKEKDKSATSPVDQQPSSPPGGSSSAGGESALDRWRRRMADEGRDIHQKSPAISPATSPTRTSYQGSSSSHHSALDDILYGSQGLSRSNSMMDPVCKRLDFNSNERGWSGSSRVQNDRDANTGSLRSSSSHMSLPRRRRDRAVGSRLQWHHQAVNGGISASSGNLEAAGKAGHNNATPLSQQRQNTTSPDSTGSSGSRSLKHTPSSSERSLTSRRFQQLFSSGNDSDEDGNNNKDYPDSLEGNSSSSEESEGEEGMKYGIRSYNKKPASSLTRSASSASTILRGSGWSPASRLLRDRYDIGGESPANRQNNVGTRSNWAAWMGDIYGANNNDSVNNKPSSHSSHGSSSSRTDKADKEKEQKKTPATRADSLKRVYAGLNDKTNDFLTKSRSSKTANGSSSSSEGDSDLDVKENAMKFNSTSAVNSKGDVNSVLSASSQEPVPLPPSALHLAGFPGYSGIRRTTGMAAGVGGGGASRTGHWAGHVPMAARNTQPEMFLYRGSANVDDSDQCKVKKEERKSSPHSNDQAMRRSPSSMSNSELYFQKPADSVVEEQSDVGHQQSKSDGLSTHVPQDPHLIENHNKPSHTTAATGTSSGVSKKPAAVSTEINKGNKMRENESEVKSTPSDHDRMFSGTDAPAAVSSPIPTPPPPPGVASGVTSINSDYSQYVAPTNANLGVNQRADTLNGLYSTLGDNRPVLSTSSAQDPPSSGNANANTTETEGVVDGHLIKPADQAPRGDLKAETAGHDSHRAHTVAGESVGGVQHQQQQQQQQKQQPQEADDSIKQQTEDPEQQPNTPVLDEEVFLAPDVNKTPGNINNSESADLPSDQQDDQLVKEGNSKALAHSSGENSNELYIEAEKQSQLVKHSDTQDIKNSSHGDLKPPNAVSSKGDALEINVASSESNAEQARSPKVSFSDDLKVVPPSPVAGHKQLTDTQQEPSDCQDPTSIPAPTAGVPASPTKSTPSVSGSKTPVKGILQNGRKEGEIIHRPAPDDSEMRQEDSADEKTEKVNVTSNNFPAPTPSVSLPSSSVSSEPRMSSASQSTSRRHNSFSSTRDVPNTYRTFMSRPGSHSNAADKPRNNSSSIGTPTTQRRSRLSSDTGTPLAERRARVSSGHGGSTQSLYSTSRSAGGSSSNLNSRSSSLRASTGGQRSSWSSRHRGGLTSQDPNLRKSDRDLTSVSTLNRSRRSSARGSADNISSLHGGTRGSTENVGALSRGGLRGSTDVVGSPARRGVRSSIDDVRKSGQHEKTPSRKGDRSEQKEPVSPRHGEPDDTSATPREKSSRSSSSQDSDNPGFTLSFKDFMEQRKKQGTVVLPRSQDRGQDSQKDSRRDQDSQKDSRRDQGSPKSHRKDQDSHKDSRRDQDSHKDSRRDRKEGRSGRAYRADRDNGDPNTSVTLSSLKQLRENRDRKPSESDHGADSKGHSGEVKQDSESREGEADDTNAFKRKEDSGRWSFRSRNRRKAESGDNESRSNSSSKKDQSMGAVLSSFFRRGKKSRRDRDTRDDVNDYNDVADNGESPMAPDLDSRQPEESKTGSTGHRDAEHDPDVSGSRSQASEGEGGFILGPHGHSDGEHDPLSVLFMKAEQAEQADDEQENELKDTSKRDNNVSPSLKLKGSPRVQDRSPVGLLLDMVGSRSDSPALSAISSIDDGGIGRNRHYEKPDYKHFLDMDSLVASITTGQQQNAEVESSSGVSGTVSGTETDSASGMGSLEDLAMALLEAELREEGLLEGEPGLPEPANNQDYAERIQGIKADLQKFSAHLGHALKKHRHGGSGEGSERAPSVSDLSVTSTRSSRSPWLRDPTIDAKPISDPALRSKLKTARSASARVSSRDQRILELMMAKREEEKSAEAKRQKAHRVWETQKQHDDAVKTTSEIKRRESLVRQRQKEKDLHKSRRHSESTDSLHSTYSEKPQEDDGQESEEAHRYKERQWGSQAQRIAELRHGGHRYRSNAPLLQRYKSEGNVMKSRAIERPWVATQNNAQLLKEKKMAERRLQNMQRKKSQEERIAAQKREQEDMARLVVERQERELKRANSVKEAKEQEQLMQRKLKSYYQKKRHDDKMHELKRKSREDLHTLQSAIEIKQATAQSHLQQVEQRRYNELRKSTTDLDTRISRSRENQQRLQEEMHAWHDDLHKYSKMMEKRAEEQAKLAKQQKAKRAAEDRRQKEKQQKKNLDKLLAQEEEWKADVEATIAMKDAKARMLQMEKEESVQESRAMAAASQRMREELRNAYSTDGIDQLARQAQLQAKLGLESSGVNSGISSTTKNMSTLTLG